MGKSVSYTINAKDKTKAALDSAKGGVKGFASQLGSLKGIIAGSFAVAGIKMAADKIGELTDAYGIQQAAELKLTAAAKNNPLLNGEAVNRLKAHASQLQGTSIYGDEQMIEMEAWLAAQGRTEDQIKDIMSASVDLAASGVMPLESAVKNLGKTYSGTTGLLSQSIPTLKDLTKEQLENGEAVKMVADQYKGMAASVAAGVAGTKTQIANLKGDIKEQLGEIWIGITNDANKKLLPIFNKINEWLTNNKKTIINVFRNIPEIAKTAFDLIKSLARQIFSVEFLVSFGKVVFDFVLSMGKTTFELLFSYLKAIGTTFWSPLSAGFEWVIYGIKTAFNAVINFFISGLNDIIDKINIVAGSGLAQKLGISALQTLELRTTDAQRPDANVGADISGAWKEVWGNIKDFVPDQIDNFKSYLSDILETGAELFGDEFSVFSDQMQTILNEPLEIDTSMVSAAIAAGIEEGNNASSDSSGGGFLSGLFSDFSGSMTGMIDMLGGASGILSFFAANIESVNALLNWQATVLDGFLSVIAEPLNEILEPFVGILQILGKSIGAEILPIIKLLSPLLELIAQGFIILYNNAMMPFANLIIGVITVVNNVVATIVNAIIDAINAIPFISVGGHMNTMNYDDYALSAISMDDLTNAGSSYTSSGYSSGSGASYTQTGDVYITMNMTYTVGLSAFDDNDLAVKIYSALERVKKLGLVA